MERGDAQFLGLATVTVGLLLVGISWWCIAKIAPRRTVLPTLAAIALVGGLIALVGVFYSLYAFNPDAGR